MQQPLLFMLLLGSRAPGRNTEQHDVFFGIGETVKDLVPAIKAFWPEAKGNLHIDAWREVRHVDGFTVTVLPRVETGGAANKASNKLFFLNLGGYKAGAFDEFHYKMLAVAENKNAAIRQARQTAFYKHTGIKGAPSHIDEKFGVDVDELYQVKDILPAEQKEQYILEIKPEDTGTEDELHLGYFKLNKL